MIEIKVIKILAFLLFFVIVLMLIQTAYSSKKKKPDKYRRRWGEFILPTREEFVLAIVFVVSFMLLVAIL